MISIPHFRSGRLVLDHIRRSLDYYAACGFDPSGGFYHDYRGNGDVGDRHTRDLASSARFASSFAKAYRQFGDPADLARVRHALSFLRRVHRDPASGGYAWRIDWRDGRRSVLDATNHCDGLALVLLAYAHALQIGLEEARPWVVETYALLEHRFWESEHGLYAAEATPDWSDLALFRSQKANMRVCQALIATYAATGEPMYVRRAATLARNVTLHQAALGEGVIWEYYRADWSVQSIFCRRKSDRQSPRIFKPGHLAEWAKLLLILEDHPVELDGDTHWLALRAQALFDVAVKHAWDEQHGGLAHACGSDGAICDLDKYLWVQAESLSAAGLLAERTGEARYRDWYQRLRRYIETHFVGQAQGAWYRVLAPIDACVPDETTPAGKMDYRTIGTCFEMLAALTAWREPQPKLTT